MTARDALAVLLLAVPATAALGADAASETPRFTWGVEERLRDESWDNQRDFTEDADDRGHQLRLRSRLWASLALGTQARLRVGLNNESKKVFTPDTPFKWDEVVFEEMAVAWTPSPAWSATVGRQNLQRGDGFVLMDGTPLDGSRTYYFNALVASRHWGKRRLDLLGIVDPRAEQFLPVFNDRERGLIEWDEEAIGLYWEDRADSATSIDAYLLSKSENDDPRTTSALFQADRRVETLGGRVERDLGGGWRALAELAIQAGEEDPDRDVRAWGGQAWIRRTLPGGAKLAVQLGYVALSGDDPATARVEGWDPLFSRWPKWSELVVYSLAQEKGTAYWSNLRTWQLEVTARPWTPLGLRATWYPMGAFHPHAGDPVVFGTGRERGDLVELRADLALPAGFKTHVVYERLVPGSFYAGSDPAHFLRAEVMYSLRR